MFEVNNSDLDLNSFFILLPVLIFKPHISSSLKHLVGHCAPSLRPQRCYIHAKFTSLSLSELESIPSSFGPHHFATSQALVIELKVLRFSISWLSSGGSNRASSPITRPFLGPSSPHPLSPAPAPIAFGIPHPAIPEPPRNKPAATGGEPWLPPPPPT